MKNMGPGAVVTAAVVGPGTVTTCGLAGFNYGFALAWALLFSVIAMAIIQRMTGKIGLVAGMGLAEAIRKSFMNSPWRIPLTVLIIIALFCGNCAYQAGNVVGDSTGVSIIFGDNRLIYCLVISAAALALVLSGSIKYISNVLTDIVFLMAVVFLITAIVVQPDVGALLRGMVTPTIPEGSMLTAIALIGTTLVPYCIYLHASTNASKKAADPAMDVDDVLVDNTYDSVCNAILTAIISVSIMVVGCSLALRGSSVSAVNDLAQGLEPLAGTWASNVFAVGIFAAGISSATTAPLAATYVITGILGWSTDLKDTKFRIIAVVVFAIGCIAAIMGGTPTDIITIAQAFNGVVLPLSVCMVAWIATRSEILGKYVNGAVLNVLSVVVLIITLVMAYRTFVVYAPQIVAMFTA